MKKFILALTCCFAMSNVSAMTAEELKNASMEACSAQAEAVPEEQREIVSRVCECTVNNTDYEMLVSAQTDSSKLQEIQTKALEVAQECAAAETG